VYICSNLKIAIVAFTSFKSLAEVLKTYKIKYQERDFIITATVDVPPALQEDISFTLNEVAYDISESAICENLIYPILKAAWRRYSDILAIWSRPSLLLDAESGIPDYLISKKSEYGKIMLETPYVTVVEAKKDDFTSGWAQCSAEMYAMQKLNGDEDLPIYGIVSNGETWEFAYLERQIFTKFKQIYVVHRLDDLFKVLCSLLDVYKKQFALAH
jgi:hypothetical protein